VKTKNLHQDIYISGAIFLVLGFLFVASIKIPGDSAIFPRLVLAGMAILNLFVLLRALKLTKESKELGKDIGNDLTFEIMKWPLIVILATVMYAVLFKFTNFFIASTVFLIVIMKLYKIKSWKTILLVTVIFNVLVYLGFVLALNVPLV